MQTGCSALTQHAHSTHSQTFFCFETRCCPLTQHAHHTHTHTHTHTHIHTHTHTHSTHTHTHTTGRHADQMLSTHSIHAAHTLTQTQTQRKGKETRRCPVTGICFTWESIFHIHTKLFFRQGGKETRRSPLIVDD